MEPLRARSAGSKSLLFSRFLAPKMSFRSDQENTPPVHPNIQIDRPPSPLAPKKPSEAAAARPAPAPECDRSNPAASAPDPSDSSVKVVVRIRPGNRHERGDERIVRKVSSDSVAVGDRSFKFDSILGSESTQEDVFNLVGVPLVRNSLAGFNTSIVSYGQTGSGKTYTMWGPPSAMVDSHSSSSFQGVVPRIFQMLFSEINKKQEGAAEEKQTNYQCRCSFLEIYNNQVSDLLDPTQRNLQIRDDAKNGFHVENLTEEYVTATDDVTQLLVKGLANRKVGTTTTNSKSSRSHIIFTCVIESWCKGSSSKCFGSSKTSRINLVDLAGADTDKLDDASKYCVKEGRHVKKSLSKLGKLVNTLSEMNSGKEQKIQYMDSSLTHLLQETLGGNAKVTLICAVFPNERHKSGTLSTLRFGERVAHIQNKAVINEITEDDVNGLSDQIRQLRDELISAKSYGGSSVSGYFKGRNGRDSLNLLRVSLNRSLILPHIDNDSEEEIDIHEEDMKELCVQLSTLDSSNEHNLEHISEIDNEDISENENPPSDESAEISRSNIMESYLDEHSNASLFEEEKIVLEEEKIVLEVHATEVATNGGDISLFPNAECDNQIKGSLSKSSLSITTPMQSPNDPTLCESPKISNRLRKSIISLSGCLDSETNGSNAPRCFARCDSIRSSLQSTKVCPTESLAASLQKGLQIIDYHQQNPAIKKSFVGFSFEHLAAFSRPRLDKVDASVQTLSDGVAATLFLCSSCRKVETSKVDHETDSEMQIIPVNEAGTPVALKKQVQKDDDMFSAVIKRERELEALCAEQAATIERLNHLVQQNGCEQNSSIKENSIPQILGLTGSTSVANGHLLLQHNEENHHDNKSYFDVAEREALLGEIQTLREQLKSYTDVSTEDSPLEQIRNGGSGSGETREQIEKERQKWTESESRWISLTEELRLDLESNRRVSERKDKELNTEKELTAELDDALHRAMVGHARMVEHYAELQEKHESLLWSHKKVMEGIAEVKRAAAKAGGKRAGSAFVSALAAELSTLRIEREKERAYLKEQNKGLRTQLRDTAEAVHAAGELLVRLREAEEAVSVTEEKYGRAQQEIEKLKRQIDKMKKKHKMEMVTMKHYLAESRLPEEALEPFYLHDPGNAEDAAGRSPAPEDEQSWRSAFSPSYH